MVKPSLSEACGILKPQITALTGGGGKTSLLWAFAEERCSAGDMVVVTTTTHILPPLPQQSDSLLLIEEAANLWQQLREIAAPGRIITVAKGLSPDGKLMGISGQFCQTLVEMGCQVLVEADGAARKPFKAPAAHEPVVPEGTCLQIAVCGLSVVGKPLQSQFCHRPERIAALTGAAFGTPVTPHEIAQTLASSQGGRKGLPEGAAFLVCLNQADDEFRLTQAETIAALLQELGVRRVLATCTYKRPIVQRCWGDVL